MADDHHHGSHQHHQDQHHHVHFDTPEMVQRAEQEATMLSGLVARLVDRVAGECDRHGAAVRRVLDVGCGPGVGTCLLASRFCDATVVAADGSNAMLDRAIERATELGLADRIERRRVELPEGIDGLGRADLLWASLVVHHVGDEVGALRRMRTLLAPGGLLAVVERAAPLRVLPDAVELGRPGLWARLDAAWERWFVDMRATVPDVVDPAGAAGAAGYGAAVAAAGFEVLVDEVVHDEPAGPLDDDGRRFAAGQVRRTVRQLDGYAAADDLAALAALLDGSGAPDGTDDPVLTHPDAVIRASRQLVIARA